MLTRPFVILKYAKSADGFIGKAGEQVWLTNAVTKRLVHKWRSEVDAIMVGTNTAAVDNPQLTNRLYFGSSPLRIVLDRQLRLSTTLTLFDDSQPTWVITEQTPPPHQLSQTEYLKIPFDADLLPTVLAKLAQVNIKSLIVEGGSQLLQSFITAGLWDEIRAFSAPVDLLSGIPAPQITLAPESIHAIGRDQLAIFKNPLAKIE